MLLLQAITQIWLLWLLSLHVVIYLQNEFKHKPKMAFYMYNVLYGSAVSFMRGKLKLLFLLGDNNSPTSSITILKITYKLSWCLIEIVTFKESLFQLESFRDIFLFFPLPPNRLLKPLQNKKGQKNLGYLRKKQSFYKEKDCFFLR